MYTIPSLLLRTQFSLSLFSQPADFVHVFSYRFNRFSHAKIQEIAFFFTAIFLDVVKPFWLNFGVIYTTIFTCEIIENIHIYLFPYFLNCPLITQKINAKNLKMCKDNRIKNLNSWPQLIYIESLGIFILYHVHCTQRNIITL